MKNKRFAEERRRSGTRLVTSDRVTHRQPTTLLRAMLFQRRPSEMIGVKVLLTRCVSLDAIVN